MLPTKVATQALVAFIEDLARGGFGIPLAIAIEWFGPHLKTNDTLWGTVGYALSRQGRPTAALEWLSDWNERKAVQI